VTYVYYVRLGGKWFATTNEADTTGKDNKFRVQSDDASVVEKWHPGSSQWLPLRTLSA